MTRVLLVDRSDRGGIADYSDRLRDAIRDAGHDVWLCAPPPRHADPPELARHLWGTEADGIPLGRLRLMHLGEVPVSTLAVVGAVRRYQPDVLHAQSEILPRLDQHLWRALRRRVPIVLTAHDPLPLEGGTQALERQARTWRAADAVIVHDDAGAEVVRAHAPETIVRVIPWDVPVVAAIPDRGTARCVLGLGDEPMALVLGLLRDYKGFELLADAWPTVVAERPDVRLYVVGDASELPSDLDRLAGQPGVELRRGFVPDEEFRCWAAAADVMLAPYRRGSHSGVLDQALAARTPMLVSPPLAQEVLRAGAGRVVERTGSAWSEAIADALWRDPIRLPTRPTNEITVRETTSLYESLTRAN